MAIVLPPDPSLGKPKKLLDQVCDVMRLKHYSLRTERTYCDWIARFIRFHDLRHPREMGGGCSACAESRPVLHAAMAGKTGLVIGFLHERFIHVPIELLATHTKRLDPASGWWRSVLAATGQAAQFD